MNEAVFEHGLPGHDCSDPDGHGRVNFSVKTAGWRPARRQHTGFGEAAPIGRDHAAHRRSRYAGGV